MRRHLVLHALAADVRSPVRIRMRVRLCLTLVGVLRTSVAFRRSWPLNLAPFMGMNPLAVLSDSSSMALAGAIANRPNRKVVVLLELHVHITLVQNELASLIQLLVKRFIVVVHMHLRQVIQKAAIAMAGLGVVQALLALVLAIGYNEVRVFTPPVDMLVALLHIQPKREEQV